MNDKEKELQDNVEKKFEPLSRPDTFGPLTAPPQNRGPLTVSKAYKEKLGPLTGPEKPKRRKPGRAR